jgi:hypothetical protein
MHTVLFFLHFLLSTFGGSSVHESAQNDYSDKKLNQVFSIDTDSFYYAKSDTKNALIQDLPFEIEEELQGQDDDKDSGSSLYFYDYESTTLSTYCNFWLQSLKVIHAVNFIYFPKFCSTTSPIYILQRVLRL